MVSATPRLFYPRERYPVPIVHDAGWAPEPSWTGAGNLAPTGVLTPDLPARSELLYRLRCPGPLVVVVVVVVVVAVVVLVKRQLLSNCVF